VVRAAGLRCVRRRARLGLNSVGGACSFL
jgi:hypothetical protein